MKYRTVKIEMGDHPIGQRKHPWVELEIGESFTDPRPAQRFAPYVSRMNRKYDRRFSCRSEGNGCRVVRVA